MMMSSSLCSSRVWRSSSAAPRTSSSSTQRRSPAWQQHSATCPLPLQRWSLGRRQAQVPCSQQQKAEAHTGQASPAPIAFQGVHHVALLCENLERSLEFYQGLLGLSINPDRPDNKLPYRGAWLWIGPEMIHLMELPNPDPLEGRPEHGGRDRHFCTGVESIKPLVQRLEAAGVKFTMSMSGRPAVFFRDPDMNCLEVVEVAPWR